eukprot:6782568-Ditylum_brightwellii.AAC.1
MLLRNVKEQYMSRLTLKDHMQLDSTLWVASDGGVTDGLGYFGWSIATDSFILWEGFGHSQGNPLYMESLRAESSGVLSVLRFLLQYTKYYNISFTGQTPLHYCDNSTLCGRMKAVHQGYTTTPTQNIQSDWDVQLATEETLQELNITLETHHVYHHQDTRNRPNSMEDKTN